MADRLGLLIYDDGPRHEPLNNTANFAKIIRQYNDIIPKRTYRPDIMAKIEMRK